MKPKPIGIVGGAGPLAAVSLLKQTFCFAQQMYGCWKDDDFPKVFVISFPFSDMLSQNTDCILVRNELRSCLQKLRTDGAQILAIACNTLHAFLDEEEEEREDLLQLPKIIAEEIDFDQTPLILGTSTSVRFDLYQRRYPCVYPDQKTQEAVDEIITQILKGEDVLSKLRTLIATRKEKTILLGCTELSIYTEDLLNCNKQIIDPLKTISKKLINKSFGV